MRGNAGGWEEQHLCLLSWSLKNPRRPASFWDRQRGKLSPAFEAWTGLARPYRGQTHGLDGWKRSGSSRASVFKGSCPGARGCMRGGRLEHPWSCASPACGAVLFQLECPVLLGTIFCPAVLLKQRRPTRSGLQSCSSSSGWPPVFPPGAHYRADPGSKGAPRPRSLLAAKYIHPSWAFSLAHAQKGGVCGLFPSPRCRQWLSLGQRRFQQGVGSILCGPVGVPSLCLPSTGSEIPTQPMLWVWVKAVAPFSLIPYDVDTEN